MSPALRVLCAEDDPRDADLTRSWLAEKAPDFEVELVATGQACLDRLAQTTPDILLLDNHLPDIDGLDVLRSVIRAGLPVPVVLVTGVGDEELVVKALRLGAWGYVPKLGSYLETLPELLRTVVQRHHLGLREGIVFSVHRRILYVEHNAADIDLTVEYLAEAAPQFELDVARTSADGLARLAHSPSYDAVLVDLRMPELSGLEFVREAGHRRLALPPFVMITGKGDEAAALASLKLGAADYISKREGYLERLVDVIDRAVAHDRLSRLNEQLQIELAERRRVEEALREADHRKNEFLGLLSHELRNPLMPICNSLYVLERALPGGEQAGRAQRVIGRQVGHLARLVDDLLDVTRLGSRKIQLQRSRVDLAQLVARTVEDHQAVFAERNVHLALQSTDEPLFIQGDATRLCQLVGNLLQNAAKFTEPGGTTTVQVSRDDVRQQRAVVQVRDTGAGIPLEALPRLFEPFMQADHTLDRSRGGLGLGLAMVKGLVELHGGEVSASSEGVGRGAEFTLRFPLEQLEEQAGPPTSAPAPAECARRVLVVEDNVDAALSLRDALLLDGHAVEVAYDGADALEKLRLRPFDVVLCDIGLPGMDGYDVARSIRARVDKIVLIAVTGYAQPAEVARARDAGFDQHIAKPPNLERLRSLLVQLPGGH